MEGSAKTNTAGLQRWQDARADYYTGTKEQLIAAGICEARWFPEKLIAQVRRNGEPYLGNNGKQRTKRVYRVEGRQPETILTHRRNADGSEKWIIEVAVDDAERERRDKAEEECRATQRAEHQKSERGRLEREARAREGARPTVMQLRARYPELFKIEGEVNDWEVGTRRQSLTFYARSLDVLVRYGLIIEEMLAVEAKGCYDRASYRRNGDLRDGRSFYIYEKKDPTDTYCYVRLWTIETPRERKSFPVTEARRLLKQLAECVRGKGG